MLVERANSWASMTEDEMVDWHHQLNGHEFEQAPGVGDGQGGLAYCSPWDFPRKNTGVCCHFPHQQRLLFRNSRVTTGIYGAVIKESGLHIHMTAPAWELGA